MATNDKCVTIVPYFKIAEGKLDEYKDLCRKCVEKSNEEEKCLYYGFSFNGDEAHCREGYADGEAALEHLESIGPLLEEILKISDLTSFEIHGPREELEKIRESLEGLNPKYYVLEYGFRR